MSGAVENDTLNKLVLTANANWHEIKVVRAYVRYMKQLNSPYSCQYIEKAVTENPAIARLLIDLFKVLLDPEKQKDSAELATQYRQSITEELIRLYPVDSDRILRTILNLIESTLRTNYFQRTPRDAARVMCPLSLIARISMTWLRQSRSVKFLFTRDLKRFICAVIALRAADYVGRIVTKISVSVWA